MLPALPNLWWHQALCTAFSSVSDHRFSHRRPAVLPGWPPDAGKSTGIGWLAFARFCHRAAYASPKAYITGLTHRHGRLRTTRDKR